MYALIGIRTCDPNVRVVQDCRRPVLLVSGCSLNFIDDVLSKGRIFMRDELDWVCPTLSYCPRMYMEGPRKSAKTSASLRIEIRTQDLLNS